MTKTPSKTREKPLTPLEKAVLSRRPSLAVPEDDDEFFEQGWETEGSGLGEAAAEKLIHQLYVSLGSIKAGNTSTKLRKEVVSLLSVLVKHGVLNEFQRRKNSRRLYSAMTYHLLLDSRLAKLQRNGANQDSHDFRIFFNHLLSLTLTKIQSGDERTDHHGLLLVRHCRSPRKQQTEVAKENWSLANRFLQGQTGFVDPDAEYKEYIFNFYFNFITYRVARWRF